MDSSSVGNTNRYWVLRHGKSIPNERGLVVSSMENGVLPEYQLAPDGVAQARLAGESFLQVWFAFISLFAYPTPQIEKKHSTFS
jgi:broad specificity phosphatase PhoE